MSNFSKTSVAQDARTELHDILGLTGAEVSINNLPAGVGVPFIHSHKQNEEIYERQFLTIKLLNCRLVTGLEFLLPRRDSSLLRMILQLVLLVFRLRRIHLKVIQ